MKVTMCEKRKFSIGCPWSGFSWVSGMKVRDNLGSVSEFGSENPCGFFVSAFVACPTDQIKDVTVSTTFVYLGIKDFQYFVLGFTVNFDWRWRQLDSIWDRVRSRRFEHRDMEDRVNCTHAVRKS